MDDKPQNLPFPTHGVNVATSFGQQPKESTPVGENCRAFEAIANRGRGGSRPGLTKFLADAVPAGANVIQHLAIIVDPQAPALRGDVNPQYLDPSSNNLRLRNPGGRRVRTGGSAWQPRPYGAPDPYEPEDEPEDGIYRGTVTSITLGDGDFILEIAYDTTGNGSRNGLIKGVEAAITPDPFGITASVPTGFEGWKCSSAAFDQVANEVITVGMHIRTHQVSADPRVPSFEVDLIQED